MKALDGETSVVLEHAGRYYKPIAKALLIKEYGANSLQSVKTGKPDALKIACYALDNWADLRDFTPMDNI